MRSPSIQLPAEAHARRIGPESAANLTCEGPSDELLEVEEALQGMGEVYADDHRRTLERAASTSRS